MPQSCCAQVRAAEKTKKKREEEASAVWLKPEVVAEVKFTEWTQGPRLRHGEFERLREDKAAVEVMREGITEDHSPG